MYIYIYIISYHIYIYSYIYIVSSKNSRPPVCFRAPPAEPKATEEIQPNCGPGFINGLVQGTSKTETIDFSHEIWGFPGFFFPTNPLRM